MLNLDILRTNKHFLWTYNEFVYRQQQTPKKYAAHVFTFHMHNSSSVILERSHIYLLSQIIVLFNCHFKQMLYSDVNITGGKLN